MYYLIEISETATGTAKAITEKASRTEAKMALHQTFASAMANNAVDSCLCIVIDAHGATQAYEYWQREA